MRVAVIVRPKLPPPPEQLPRLVQSFADWREAYRDHMEVFEFFAGAGGGIAILNVPEEATLNQMMIEFPLFPFTHVRVTPLLDGDMALAQWQQAVRSMDIGGAGSA